jgi:hypothetical protein
LTTRSLSQYTHFIALNPNLKKHYSNHGLAGQCLLVHNTESLDHIDFNALVAQSREERDLEQVGQ